MTILFAVDLSEPPEVTRAVEELADRMEAQLLVLHVCPPSPSATLTPIDPLTGLSAFAPYSQYDPQLEENIEKAEEDAFQAFLTERFSRPIHAALHKGVTVETIVSDADEHDVDMIVLGKRHHSRLEELLLGSTTARVLKESTRPVLLMPIVAS